MHFVKIFFLTTLLLVATTLGFIYSIDPYDKYGINVFGFETKAVAMARENKFNMVEHSKKNYEAFVIGSSSAHRLHTDDVKALTGLETFNYAVQHTTPEDYLAIVRHILSKYNPKLLLLQMDFYGLNEHFKTDTRFYTSPLLPYLEGNNKSEPKSSWFDMDYFTLGAISDSFKVIWVNLSGKVKHLYLENGNYQKEKPYEGPILVTQFAYENYEISERRVRLLQEISRLAKQKGVKLIVWSAPYSLEHIQMIQKDPKLAQILRQYKQVLAGIFDGIYDFTNSGVAPYNSTQYFRDSSHPQRELFQIVLKKVLQGTDGGDKFGEKIDP